MRLVEFFNQLREDAISPKRLTPEDVEEYGMWLDPKSGHVIPVVDSTHTIAAVEIIGVDPTKHGYAPGEVFDMEDTGIIGDAVKRGWVRITTGYGIAFAVEGLTADRVWAGVMFLRRFFPELQEVQVFIEEPFYTEKLRGKRFDLFLNNKAIPSKFIKEEMRGVRIKTFSPLEGEGTKVVTVLVNEEPGEILDMLDKKSQMRGLSFGDSDTYWWDSYEATHEEVWYVLKEIYGKMPVHPWFLEYREGGPPRFAYARMAAEPSDRNAGMRNPHISRLIDYIRQAKRAA